MGQAGGVCVVVWLTSVLALLILFDGVNATPEKAAAVAKRFVRSNSPSVEMRSKSPTALELGSNSRSKRHNTTMNTTSDTNSTTGSGLELKNFETKIQYNTTEAEILDDGLLPFYTWARKMIWLGVSQEYPYKFAKILLSFLGVDLVTYESDASAGWFLFGFSLGAVLLFIYFCKLVCCFPLCLCCSACCRRRTLYTAPPTPGSVNFWGLVVLVGTFFTFVGLCLTYGTNAHLTESVYIILMACKSIVLDVSAFTSYFFKNVVIMFENLNTTSDAVLSRLANIGPLMGNHIRESLFTTSGLATSLPLLLKYETVVNDARAKIDRIFVNVNKMETELRTLGGSPVNITKPNFGPMNASLTALMQTNLTLEASKATESLRTLSDQVASSTGLITEHLKSNLDDQVQKLVNFKDIVEKFQKQVDDAIQIRKTADLLDDTKSKIEDARPQKLLNTFLTIDFIALVLLAVGVVLLMLVYRDRYRDIQKGTEGKGCCTTVLSGDLMYAGIGIFSLFGMPWMMLCLFLYVFGGGFDILLCSIANDPSFEVIDELVENRNLFGPYDGETFLGDTMNIPNSTLTFGSIMRSCEDDNTLFEAFELEKLPQINFTHSLITFFDNLNVTGEFLDFDIPSPTVHILSSEVTQYLDGVSLLIGVAPFTQIEAITTLQFDERPGHAESQPIVQRIKKLQQDIKTDSDSLKKDLQWANDSKADTIAKVQASEGSLFSIHKAAVVMGVDSFKADLRDIVLDFVDFTMDGLTRKLGKCRFLFSFYKTLVMDSLCGNVMNVLNGMWLALGWLHFVMLSTIFFAVKLNRMIPNPNPSKPPPPPKAPIPVQRPRPEPSPAYLPPPIVQQPSLNASETHSAYEEDYSSPSTEESSMTSAKSEDSSSSTVGSMTSEESSVRTFNSEDPQKARSTIL